MVSLYFQQQKKLQQKQDVSSINDLSVKSVCTILKRNACFYTKSNLLTKWTPARIGMAIEQPCSNVSNF